MPPTNRRPREVDTSQHFCPHAGCAYRGWLDLGNLRANGHPRGGPWCQFHCTSCSGYFLETHGTIFHGKQATVELIVRVLACLAEGLSEQRTQTLTGRWDSVCRCNGGYFHIWVTDRHSGGCHCDPFAPGAYRICDLDGKKWIGVGAMALAASPPQACHFPNHAAAIWTLYLA